MAEYVEAWLTGPQATQFYTRTYNAQSPKAVAIFVHGFAEHIGRYTHIHPRLSQNGITVFTFDQRGFGKTGQDLEKKSKNSAYGKTSWREQFEDIEWAINHVKTEFPDLPLFLMGHSMGGALVLGFATRSHPPPDPEAVKSLAGVISQSPLVHQRKPASKILRWIGGKASLLSPHTLIPTEIKPEYLSHDPAVNEAYIKDPLVKALGSLRGVNDMLCGGEELLKVNFKFWPEGLPVLFVHGTEDQITCPKATAQFYSKISAANKKLELVEGGYHELQNEPEGVKERVYDNIIAFIDACLGPTSKL